MSAVLFVKVMTCYMSAVPKRLVYFIKQQSKGVGVCKIL